MSIRKLYFATKKNLIQIIYSTNNELEIYEIQRRKKELPGKKLFILTFLLFLFFGEKKGHNKSLPMVSDLASMGQDIKRCSLRSAGSLPEGIAHPTTYITTNVPCSNERGADDDSLYGTPKEEIPPFMVCITILYYKITLQKLTNL